MKTTRLKIAATLAASFGLLAGGALADTAYSNIVGYNTVTCLAGSDTIVSVPFSDSIAFAGTTTATVVDNADGTHSITVNTAPTLTSTVAYYLKFTTTATADPHDGEVFEVITASSSGTTVVVDDMGDDLTNVVIGTQVEIAPFWTLATLFPPGTTTTIHQSTGTLTFQRETEVLLPDNATLDQNLSASARYYMLASGWIQAVAGNPGADGVLLWPDSFFTIRHPSDQTATTYTPAGTVDEGNFTVPLRTDTVNNVDSHVAIPRPVPIRLDELNLGGTDAFLSSTGTLTFQRGDELLVFDNASALQNKSASARYYYIGAPTNGWRQAIAGNPPADSVQLNPSEGVIIRKKPSDGNTKFWVNTPNY